MQPPMQPVKPHNSPLTEKKRHFIAASLAWDSRYFISADEIQSVEEIGGITWITLSRNRTIPLAASSKIHLDF